MAQLDFVQSDERIIDMSDIKADAIDFSTQLAKRGVIYLSRIPPFMKPNKVRTIFEQYGEVTRVYLSEEDKSKRKNRQKHGGNGSKQFVEGWVEFADKNVAKLVASSLNNTVMGGKKRSFYHDDIWNIKYLKNFKWDYLTEKFAYERRVREQKLRVSMLKSKKQNAEFMDLLSQQRTEDLIQERKRKRGEDEDKKPKKIKRTFRQARSIGNLHGDEEFQPDMAVLDGVFSK